MNDIGLILIATGGNRYTQFLRELIESARKYFPAHEVVLFTDGQGLTQDDQYCIRTVKHKIYQPDLGWPRATLMRYHAILKAADVLRQYSHVFYIDIDMLMESPIHESEICSAGITAVVHPGYPDAFERNTTSAAFVPDAHSHTYYQGCFVGGRSEPFLAMAQEIAASIDRDDAKGYVAIWHDESHLNRYLSEHPPTIALSPAYAFAEPQYLRHTERWLTVPIDKFIPKIRHLEKPDQGKWKNKK